MIKIYFKTAWRNITHQKLFSVINILGLTIGLCTCMLIATVVIDDLSYDRQWTKADQIFRIVSINKMGEDLTERSASSFEGLKISLKNDFPEVEAVSGISTSYPTLRLHKEDANGVEAAALTADTSFWKMLDIEVLSGNPRTYIDGDYSNIIITESFRKKFFPAENPVGRTIYNLRTYADKATPCLITGVIKDLPSNSIFRADLIISTKPRNETLSKKEYGSFSQNFILLKPNTDIGKFTEKVNRWYSNFVTTEHPYQHEFQPLKDVYLHSDFAPGQDVKGNYRNIYILSGVALLLLCIACINFINLGTARALQRLKETGVRKILGAARSQLVCQFLSESFLCFLLASVAAFAAYQLRLPVLKNFLGHGLSQTFTSVIYLFVAGYIVILLISILTGIYPALILSSFKPAATLKGALSTKGSSSRNVVRKALVVLQFAVSIVVLIVLIVVQQQNSFLKDSDIGYDSKGLISIGRVSWDGRGGSFKNELLNQPGVKSASITSWLPTKGAGYMSSEIHDPNRSGNNLKVWYIAGDVDLAKVMGLRLSDGRLFDKSYGFDAFDEDSLMRINDSATYVNIANRQSSILTAYTAKLLQVKQLHVPIPEAHTTPVGIVKDFNNESLKEQLKPTIITGISSPRYGGMLIRAEPGHEKEVENAVARLWHTFYPNKLLNLNRVEDMLSAQYEEEARFQKLFTVFSAISMFLAALGVLGLIIQAASIRKKEIGVRKVLGASVASIVKLFSVDFLKMVLIALLIASPLAWWLMNKWLLDYAYRITISWRVFALAGCTAAIIALLTISLQAVKAAMANPVRSLRAE